MRRWTEDRSGHNDHGAIVSLDGFIADENDEVGPLFDWLGNGDVAWAFNDDVPDE